MTLDARLARRRRWIHGKQSLLSLLILAHILVGAASEARDTPMGRAVYDRGRPAQASLALWQNWAMFSPPPSGTAILAAEGLSPSGETVPLALPRGPGTPDAVEYRYNRYGKLERSALQKNRARLQRSIAHWVCRQSAAGGTPMVEVQLFQLRTATPPPHRRRTTHPTAQRDNLRRVACR